MDNHVTIVIPVIAALLLLLVAHPAVGQLKPKGIEALGTSLANALVDWSKTNLLFDYGTSAPAEVATSWILTDNGGATYFVTGNPSATAKAKKVGSDNEWNCGLRLLVKLANAKGKSVAARPRGGHSFQTQLGTWNDILPMLEAQESKACVYKTPEPKAAAVDS